MNYQNMSDEELIQLIKETRSTLEDYEKQLNESDNSVNKAGMRSEMTRLNHLKLEANRRSLKIQQYF